MISGIYSASDDLYPALEIKDSLVRINTFNYWFIGETGYETLQEAVDAAEINDIIRGIPGIYNESEIQIGHRYRPAEPWVINKNITITSLGDAPVILKSVDESIFSIDYYSNVTFKNIIFTGAVNPNGWGGAVYSMGKNTIVVENCTFKDNVAEKGAGVYIYGNLYVKDCLFINNTAMVYGGAIVKDGDGNFFIENTKFINNSAFTYSGAVDCRGYSEVIQVFKNITFEGNTATCAGALYTSGKNVTFIDCVFNDNKAIDKGSGYSPLGGAVYVHNGVTTFRNSNFTNNYAEGTGGALQLENSVSSVVDSTGRHITIHWGILENCLIENNVALGDGGAIYTGETFRTHINITNSVIRNNIAANGALFVNLYGFYTLNNVTVENNRNTAGSSLIYTQGMYSFPESFYANTNIINSTFKDNSAERFISTTTIYSSINITNSKFENMGMLVYSYEGSVCNLTNVCEINPKEGTFYSIDNTGTLYLKNNSFANPIYNKANIGTPTFVIVLNNQSMSYEIEDIVRLEAVVVDDNNNIIIGGELVFEVGENQINSTLDDGCFVADYTVVKGIQVINASYDDVGLSNLTIKTAVIEGKSNLVILSQDIEVYLKANQFNISITDSKGNPVSDINLIINIGGIDYSVDSDLNGVALIDLDLSVGNYPVNIIFNGNDRYKPVNAMSVINVLSTIDSSDLTRGYNSAYDFVATFVDVDGKPLNNTVITFKVNNKNYSVKTDSKGAAKLTKLAVGTYSVVSINPVSLQKVTNKVVIVKRITQNKNLVMDYNDGSKFKVRIIGDNGKAVGAGVIAKITLKGKKYNIKTDKNGYAYLAIKLIPNKYKITVEYKGFKVSNTISVKSVIKAKSIAVKKAKKVKYSITLKNSKGKALKNKKVTFKIKGKTYNAKTNSKGVASVYLNNLNVGKHKIVITYLKSKVAKTVNIKK
jgi:predicted outer membrane repeat protein